MAPSSNARFARSIGRNWQGRWMTDCDPCRTSPAIFSGRPGTRNVCTFSITRVSRRAFQTRADLQNQAMGWLRMECDSLGGGTVVRFSQNWGSSGECRLKGLLVQKGFPTCLYRVLGYFRFRPARWGRFICTACLAGTKAGRILLKPQPLPRSQISCASLLSMKSLKSRPPMRKLFGRSSRIRYTVSQFQISTSLTMKVNSFYSSGQWQMSFVQVGTS